MLLFPNAKINLGLRVIEKRRDGYHSIETLFIPVGLFDCLEFVEISGSSPLIDISGAGMEVDLKDNLVYKAWQIFHRAFHIPAVHIHLHKVIPAGAGLGGGSSDAAFMLKGLNKYFACNCTQTELETYATEIGSDCAFFIRNKPAIGYGRGEILMNVHLPLDGYEILLVNPGIHISTREAYEDILCTRPDKELKELIQLPLSSWQDNIVNDFEVRIFRLYPLISEIKQTIINCGALYAAMSGSGSTVYGIFGEGEVKQNQSRFDKYDNFSGKILI
jgi:4-diphosphocytidyl-2-C-methyl-D-erythritol kinase